MKSLTVIGRRWFQKSAGNTYNSCDIVIDGATVAYLAPSYGYGDYYLQRAGEWLEGHGDIPAGRSYPLSVWCRANGVAFTYSVSDVARERDL